MPRVPRLPSALEGVAPSIPTMLAHASELRPTFLELRQPLWLSEVV